MTELAPIVKELVHAGLSYGQVRDPVIITTLCTHLQLIDAKYKTKLSILCKNFIEFSKMAPCATDTYTLRVIGKISEGMLYGVNVVEETGKIVPVQKVEESSGKGKKGGILSRLKKKVI